MNPFKILLIYLFCILFVFGCSKYKIVDSSSQAKPSWIYKNRKDLMIGFGTGASLGDAKIEAYESVKKNITEAIAQTIKLHQKLLREERFQNQQYTQNSFYQSDIISISENIPEISGLSISKIEKIYWERIRDHKKIYYQVYILYPFSQDQIHKLISVYKGREEKINAQFFSMLEKPQASYQDVDDIISDREKLKFFYDHFKDQRKSLAGVKLKELENMLSNLKIVLTKQDITSYTFGLAFNGNKYKYSGIPQVISDCGQIETLAIHNTDWQLAINLDGCDYRTPHFLEIAYSDKYLNISRRIPFDLAEKYVVLSISGPIYFKTKDWHFWENERQIKCYITLDNKSALSFKVTGMNLSISKSVNLFLMDEQYIEMPAVIIDNVNQVFHGKGKQILSIDFSQSLLRSLAYSSSGNSTVSGHIYFTQMDTNQKHQYEFKNIVYKTDW